MTPQTPKKKVAKKPKEQPIFVGHLKRVTLAPDDLLVISSEKELTRTEADRILQNVKIAGIKNKVIILSQGLELGVLSK